MHQRHSDVYTACTTQIAQLRETNEVIQKYTLQTVLNNIAASNKELRELGWELGAPQRHNSDAILCLIIAMLNTIMLKHSYGKHNYA